jgi:glutamate dehydrogenase (NAD(P)+)
LSLGDLRLSIQGFGNVGSWAALAAVERGCKLVAVADRFGGLVNPSGLDIRALFDWVRQGGTVADYAGAGDHVSADDVLLVECDVLIPAALGEVITEDNAGRVQANVVIEAANYPTTPAGDKILGDRGIDVVPDILANAGGVTGSYFEWTMDIQQFTWKEERFNEELRERLQRAYAATAAFADSHHCTMRQAAYAIGIDRVATASRLRGYV